MTIHIVYSLICILTFFSFCVKKIIVQHASNLRKISYNISFGKRYFSSLNELLLKLKNQHTKTSGIRENPHDQISNNWELNFKLMLLTWIQGSGWKKAFLIAFENKFQDFYEFIEHFALSILMFIEHWNHTCCSRHKSPL